MISVRLTTILILSLIPILLTGCFSSNPADIAAFDMPDSVNTSCEKYILQPPDEVLILCSEVPEIHQQTQRIRPDGKISFEGIGVVDAAGKTPEELAEILRVRALDLYKSQVLGDNSIDLRVVAYESQFYYVLGQVAAPGPRQYSGRDTVISAIALARPNAMAWIERIQVIRPSSDKNVKPAIFEVNFDKMGAHGDTSKNVLLQNGDVIYVPPTVLAAVALKLEEIITPIARAFSGTYMVESGGRGYYNRY